ncbi:hypothetical protein L7F22_043627 [Adiantum nelumboides]|nr:hypothetical protein [Adiantum nelumboides]
MLRQQIGARFNASVLSSIRSRGAAAAVTIEKSRYISHSSKLCTPASNSKPSTNSSSSTSSTNPSTSSSSAPSSKGKSAREWVIVGATGGVAVAGAWWYLTTSPGSSDLTIQQQKRTFSMSPPPRTQFTIPMRASDGSLVHSKPIYTLHPNEVDFKLREFENKTHVTDEVSQCLVQRYETNSLASNAPIEDRHAQVIVQRDREAAGMEKEKLGDLAFFAVMDGHAGWSTSHLLSNKLIPLVAVELDKVIREAGEYGQIAKAKATLPAKLWRSIFGGPESVASSEALSTSGLDGDPEIIKRAISKAFRGLDKEIVNRPVGLLKEYELARDAMIGKQNESKGEKETRRLSSLAQSVFPQGSSSGSAGEGYTVTQRSAYETMLPALSGSCALLTYIDTMRGDIYVACTGDSRAVAGWWDTDKQRWEVEALSKDQTGRNEEEAKRMRSEHPASESEHVIMRGRVLGGLEPTRAFGDARYKWDRSLQDRLYDAFLPPESRSSVRGPPKHLLTPPYVTAEPVVEWRRLSQNKGRQLKFIIMATDGLWDDISNQDAVGLVATHLSGFRGTLDAAELQARCYTANNKSVTAGEGTQTDHIDKSAQETKNKHPLLKDKLSRYVFEDDNLATHLTRNALGGANRERVASLLAIPAPHSRRYRDDITVNVIVFNQPSESNINTNTPASIAEITEPAPKAKL